jgi:hypothetical protein
MQLIFNPVNFALESPLYTHCCKSHNYCPCTFYIYEYTLQNSTVCTVYKCVYVAKMSVYLYLYIQGYVYRSLEVQYVNKNSKVKFVNIFIAVCVNNNVL